MYAIENYRKYTLRLQNKTPEEIEQTKKTLIAELNALRAVFEFDLLRHYGGYPIIERYTSWEAKKCAIYAAVHLPIA